MVIITGATNGIGRLVALDLARQGVRLGIVARSRRKIDELRRELATEADSFLVDLTSLRDVRRVGEEIAARPEPISMLINNAGVHAFSQRVTAEGFSEMVAVNYLAPWVLTNALRDKLVAAGSARVVTTASGASRQAGGITPSRDVTFVGEYKRRQSFALYGRSKLMDIMFSQELARRLAGTGVTSNCCDPGFNTSGLGRELPFAGPLEKVLTTLRVGDPRRGAGIITRLAVDPSFAATTGGYFSVRGARPLECPEPGRGADVQRELWDVTAEIVAGLGVTGAE
jgi:NAD(P)-dependent dehydrogenase (short-subunit alcohol dehydrogenase family)